MTGKNEEIVCLRRQGLSYSQIAKRVGSDKCHCGYVCRSAGLGGEIIKLSENVVADYVSRSGFDYVGGYRSAKQNITVRCRRCGYTFERQYHVFRDVVNGTWKCNNECPACRKQKQKDAKQKKEHDARTMAEQLERERLKKKAVLISRQMQERLANYVCKNCGISYCIEVTQYNSKKYCSEACMKRYAMRIKNDRRIRKVLSRKHDKDITLEKVFVRDSGICYLCGNLCNWEDIEDGIAGNNYPSIDHVVPISKGGLHVWSNIKLACRNCNGMKRDKIIPR